MPKCRECHSEDVAVELKDLCGISIWFCAEDWEAVERERKAFIEYLERNCP